MAGCAVTPLESLRGASLGRYLNRAMLWIVVTALGTVGYTTVDKLAAELIAPGPAMAARYGIMETAFTLPPLWLLLKALRQEREGEPGWAGWGWPALTALGVFGGYWLVLWAYQLVPYASYVVATRQLEHRLRRDRRRAAVSRACAAAAHRRLADDRRRRGLHRVCGVTWRIRTWNALTWRCSHFSISFCRRSAVPARRSARSLHTAGSGRSTGRCGAAGVRRWSPCLPAAARRCRPGSA